MAEKCERCHGFSANKSRDKPVKFSFSDIFSTWEKKNNEELNLRCKRNYDKDFIYFLQ